MGHIQSEDSNDLDNLNTTELFIILVTIMVLVILVGTLGYHIFGDMSWIDAFHNGSMILTSTSLVTPVNTYEGKLFSSFYNLFCGIFIIVIIGIIVRKLLPNSQSKDQKVEKKNDVSKCIKNETYRNILEQLSKPDPDRYINDNSYDYDDLSSVLNDSSFN